MGFIVGDVVGDVVMFWRIFFIFEMLIFIFCKIFLIGWFVGVLGERLMGDFWKKFLIWEFLVDLGERLVVGDFIELFDIRFGKFWEENLEMVEMIEILFFCILDVVFVKFIGDCKCFFEYFLWLSWNGIWNDFVWFFVKYWE